VGTVYCPASHDYIALVNSKGGVEGHKLKALEIDHEYKVPPAVEAYERHKKDGAVTMMICWMPASAASSTTYWRAGRSRMGSSSLGTDLVVGKKRVPSPAAGMTAFRTGVIGVIARPFYHRRQLGTTKRLLPLIQLSRGKAYTGTSMV
jgi:hypothetical protein